MKNLLIISSLCLLGSLAFAGGSSTVGPANPASINCVKLGGTLEETHSPYGTDANCVVDEWKLYREMAKRGLVKKHYSSGVGLANPAAVNCVDIKGEIRIVENRYGQEGYCVVGQWDLFRAIDVVRKP